MRDKMRNGIGQKMVFKKGTIIIGEMDTRCILKYEGFSSRQLCLEENIT